jgi:RNA polymerase sigma-70 factor (ECF subfamily)
LCCLDSVPAATLSSIGTTSTARDPCAHLLEAACSGDEEAFRRLVEPYRSPLQGHCYRMLGSLHDAEDAVQEALLRAWRGLCGFDGRSALRTWLFQITTNTCLDTIARRPKSGARPSETIRLEPYQDELLGFEDRFAAPEARYEQREAAELAFAAALQHLTPRQRAVLILRDALSLSAKEVSESLGTTVTSVNSALQRARKTVDDRLPPETKQSRMRSPDDERLGEIVQLFVDALERGDLHAIIGLLAADATSATSRHGRAAPVGQECPPPSPLRRRQRSVNASLAPRAAKVPAKTRRIQATTRGREMTWLRIAAAKYP